MRQTRKEIVITGLGVVSPIGIGRDAFWSALAEGRTGFRPITLFDASAYAVRTAGEITDFDPLPYLGKRGLRDLDRSTRLLSTAALLAADDSGLVVNDDNAGAIGVSIGTTFGSLRSFAQFDLSTLTDGPRYVNPSLFPNTVINSPASRVSIRMGIKGFNATHSTGFCASLDAVGYAMEFIRNGRTDAVLAGGVEEFCEETFRIFHATGSLAGMDGSEAMCCPFDARRSGMILAEGAAVAVLETFDHARKRGVLPLARLTGWGNSFDPDLDITFSSGGAGLARAIRDALRDADLKADAVDYIVSCANSSMGLDRMEAAAFKSVFGDSIRNIPVSAIKSMLGESCAASGAMALAAAVGAFRSGVAFPTAGFAVRDPECDLDCVPHSARSHLASKILLTAADPFGQNAALILQRCDVS